MLAPLKITLYCKQKDSDGVYHAFPVDSSNPNHDTAKLWARQDSGHWQDGKYMKVQGKEPKVVELNNEGLDHITIESLDIRGEGGRAYQVILKIAEDKFRVDLREDTLMDVIRNTGIQAGGRLNGSFCFAKDGSQTKLIREDTELHKRAVAEREKRETFTKTIKRSDLKVGHKYTTISGHSEIFLGFVYARDLDKEDGTVSVPYKAMLFISESDSIHKLINTGEITYHGDKKQYRDASTYSIKVVKSHNFKIEGPKVLEAEGKLEQYVKHIKKLAALEYKEKMEMTNYSRYFEEYSKSLALSAIAVDKKDVHIDPSEGLAILRKVNNYYNRRW